jgi:pimeloyl-ACP methyl ester carboxylesterase
MIRGNQPDQQPTVNWRFVRLALFAVAAAAIMAVGGYFGAISWQYASAFTHTGCRGTHDSLNAWGYPSQPIASATGRGYQLRGWLTRGARFPDIVIVVLPGLSGNTQPALTDAALLAKAGYSTLIYEHRSCANPALLHSGGYLEADDLVSAVQYLRSRSDVHHVGVLGFSAGGTAALLATAKDTDIEAVVGIGGFSSLEDDALAVRPGSSRADWIVRRLFLVSLGLQLGVLPGAVSPVAQIERISPRPVFLIYGQYEEQHGKALYAAARDPKQLWIVPGVGHGGYQQAYPDDYERLIVGFFGWAFSRVS